MPKHSGEAIDKHIGERIKLHRSFRGLNQKDLAVALGVTPQQIQKYESGDNRVSAGQLFRLALVLRVEMSAFFEGWRSEPEGMAEEGTFERDVPFDAYGRALNNLVSRISGVDARQSLLLVAKSYASYEADLAIARTAAA